MALARLPRDVLDNIPFRPMDWVFVGATCRSLHDAVRRQMALWFPRSVGRPFTLEFWIAAQKWAILTLLWRWSEVFLKEVKAVAKADEESARVACEAFQATSDAATVECRELELKFGEYAIQTTADMFHALKKDEMIMLLYPRPFPHPFPTWIDAMWYVVRVLMPGHRFLRTHSDCDIFRHFHAGTSEIL